MSLAVAIIRSRSKGLEAESKITYVHKLCSRRQAKEMSSETNVCSRRSLELESRRRGKRRLRSCVISHRFCGAEFDPITFRSEDPHFC
ncbi:hypothetical protein TNIN_71881 [Trichonephila inaurata madagascariensis]|uniref:Uncharacterized protein n=1 Tax=Trichonephila inaurata madagascariensis TaxID=2747483 RepID=A0A8X7BPB9_9ARAC|nr:hypothetical protein TNIN_71881 [Trichonephila inaurata madagascariensis]